MLADSRSRSASIDQRRRGRARQGRHSRIVRRFSLFQPLKVRQHDDPRAEFMSRMFRPGLIFNVLGLNSSTDAPRLSARSRSSGMVHPFDLSFFAFWRRYHAERVIPSASQGRQPRAGRPRLRGALVAPLGDACVRTGSTGCCAGASTIPDLGSGRPSLRSPSASPKNDRRGSPGNGSSLLTFAIISRNAGSPAFRNRPGRPRDGRSGRPGRSRPARRGRRRNRWSRSRRPAPARSPSRSD